MKRKRWAVFISGRGSNLAALLETRDEVEIQLVVSSNPEAHGILRAARAGVPTEMAPTLQGSKRVNWAALDELLRRYRVTHIFLAGFMRIVPEAFLSEWEGRILNLHPSLLPSYPGLESIEKAYNESAPIGVTVHEVTSDVDAGAIICQRRCLNQDEVQGYSLCEVEFLVHVDEQRVVKEAIRRWTN